MDEEKRELSRDEELAMRWSEIVDRLVGFGLEEGGYVDDKVEKVFRGVDWRSRRELVELCYEFSGESVGAHKLFGVVIGMAVSDGDWDSYLGYGDLGSEIVRGFYTNLSEEEKDELISRFGRMEQEGVASEHADLSDEEIKKKVRREFLRNMPEKGEGIDEVGVWRSDDIVRAVKFIVAKGADWRSLNDLRACLGYKKFRDEVFLDEARVRGADMIEEANKDVKE